MVEKEVLSHAGYAVCIDALDRTHCSVPPVPLGDVGGRTAEARASGVGSAPALVTGNAVCHINHGADLSAVG